MVFGVGVSAFWCSVQFYSIKPPLQKTEANRLVVELSIFTYVFCFPQLRRPEYNYPFFLFKHWFLFTDWRGLDQRNEERAPSLLKHQFPACREIQRAPLRERHAPLRGNSVHDAPAGSDRHTRQDGRLLKPKATTF